MHKVVACSILFLNIVGGIPTQAQWSNQPTGTTQFLSAISTIDSAEVIAVGSRGTILFSANNGNTWENQISGTNHWLSDVSILTRQRAVTVGWNSTILLTTNRGATWLSQTGGTTVSLYGVAFSDSNTGTAVGFGGAIQRTTDGGSTWTTQQSGITNDLRSVSFFSADFGHAVGADGTILRTTNSGESWIRQSSGSSSFLYKVISLNNQTSIVVGERGSILRTRDGGTTWTQISSGTANDLWDVDFADSACGYAVGSRGTILRTTDGGVGWTIQASGTSNDLRGVSAPDRSIGFVVGTQGTILHTENGGGCLAFPFPQNQVYPNGILPRNKNSADALQSYKRWKDYYVTSKGACGFRRVLIDDMTHTISEGIGYGMLLAVHFNDQALFDDLWSYYSKFMDETGLMHWKISDSCTVADFGPATDADEDVAFALLLADKQWCSQGRINYLEDALTQINRIFLNEVESRTFILKPGGGDWGGSHLLNPSYFAPAYYRVFAKVTGNQQWLKVADKCYDVLAKCANPKTGLVPDWCQANGKPAQERGNSYHYYWDAARTPWRIALDFLWFGDKRAQAFCTTLAEFASRIGAEKIANGYQLDGRPMNPDHINLFIGTFGAASMAAGPKYQAFCDAAYRENVLTLPSAEGSYYNWSIRTLTLCLQTGNFVHPSFVNEY